MKDVRLTGWHLAALILWVLVPVTAEFGAESLAPWLIAVLAATCLATGAILGELRDIADAINKDTERCDGGALKGTEAAGQPSLGPDRLRGLRSAGQHTRRPAGRDFGTCRNQGAWGWGFAVMKAFVRLRLRIASWLVGRHSLAVNITLRDGVLYLVPKEGEIIFIRNFNASWPSLGGENTGPTTAMWPATDSR